MADNKLSRTSELRALPDADLTAQLEKLRRDMWQNRLKAKDGSSLQTHQLLAFRRQIARIQTVLTARKAMAQQPTP